MLRGHNNINDESTILEKTVEGDIMRNKQAVDPGDTGEGDSHRELNVSTASTKLEKSWKKITRFFRPQNRSTKSNDGDGSTSRYSLTRDFNIEEKWQSLGKVFRRHSLVEGPKSPDNRNLGESSSQSRKTAVRKIMSSYFSRSAMFQPVAVAPTTNKKCDSKDEYNN